jgi:hypothetical protein
MITKTKRFDKLEKDQQEKVDRLMTALRDLPGEMAIVVNDGECDDDEVPYVWVGKVEGYSMVEVAKIKKASLYF